jgi:hypothetical protein
MEVVGTLFIYLFILCSGLEKFLVNKMKTGYPKRRVSPI